MGDFLAHHVYGSRIVLTNVSSQVQTVEVLMQIPAGCIPVTHYGSSPPLLSLFALKMILSAVSALPRRSSSRAPLA